MPPNVPTPNTADRARFFISSSTARNKKLFKVKTAKETDARDAEHVHDTGHDEPVGVTRKPGGGGLELSVYEEMGTPEVDWLALQESGEFFTFVREVVRGRRIQYLNCTVATVEADDDDSGSHMMNVKIIWTRRKGL